MTGGSPQLVLAQVAEVTLAIAGVRLFVAEGPHALVDAQQGAAGRVLDELDLISGPKTEAPARPWGW